MELLFDTSFDPVHGGGGGGGGGGVLGGAGAGCGSTNAPVRKPKTLSKCGKTALYLRSPNIVLLHANHAGKKVHVRFYM
jgi:hypothetical protein